MSKQDIYCDNMLKYCCAMNRDHVFQATLPCKHWVTYIPWLCEYMLVTKNRSSLTCIWNVCYLPVCLIGVGAWWTDFPVWQFPLQFKIWKSTGPILKKRNFIDFLRWDGNKDGIRCILFMTRHVHPCLANSAKDLICDHKETIINSAVCEIL